MCPRKKKQEDYSQEEINKSRESTPVINAWELLHKEAGSRSDQTTGSTISRETLPLQGFSKALLLRSNPKQRYQNKAETEKRERKEEKRKNKNLRTKTITALAQMKLEKR